MRTILTELSFVDRSTPIQLLTFKLEVTLPKFIINASNGKKRGICDIIEWDYLPNLKDSELNRLLMVNSYISRKFIAMENENIPLKKAVPLSDLCAKVNTLRRDFYRATVFRYIDESSDKIDPKIITKMLD